MQEQLQIPVEVQTIGNGAHDYFRYDDVIGDSLNSGSGATYNWESLVNANADPLCSNPSQPCAHAMLELWSGQTANRDRWVIDEKQCEDGGALGVLGRLGLYASAHTIDRNPGLISYRGLQDASLTRVFRKPLRFFQYCRYLRLNATAEYPGSFCQFYYATFFQLPASGGQWEEEQAAGRAEFGADAATQARRYFLPSLSGAMAAALQASGRHFPSPLYRGNFTDMGGAGGGGGGYVCNAPCTWSEYTAGQIAEGGFALTTQHNSYGDLLDYMEAGGSTGEAILFWWWQPHSIFDRWRFQGTNYKLERISLKPWNSDCQSKRPLPATKCNASLSVRDAYGPPEAQCDYMNEVLKKAFPRSLRTLSPEGYAVLKNMQLDDSDHVGLLAAPHYDAAYTAVPSMPERRRKVHCDWVKRNHRQGRNWQHWLPEGSQNLRCLNDCSGHGVCGNSSNHLPFAGDCTCHRGWAGDDCSRCAAGYVMTGADGAPLPPSVSSNGTATATGTGTDTATAGAGAGAGARSCKLVVEFDGRGGGVQPVAYAAAGLGLVITAAFSAYVAVYRDSTVIKRSQRAFLAMMLLGGFLSLSNLLLLAQPPTDASCLATVWMGHLGYALIMGPLYVKTWRIGKIFGNKKLRTVIIKQREVLAKVAALIALVLAYLLAWTLADPPAARVVTDSSRVSSVVRYTWCRSASEGWGIALLGAEFLFLLWGVQLSLMTRSVHSTFSESKWIAMAIYNVLFTSVIAISLTYGLALTPASTALIHTLAVAFATVCVLSLLLAPKMYTVSTKGEDFVTSFSAGSSRVNSQSSKIDVAAESATVASLRAQLADARRQLRAAGVVTTTGTAAGAGGGGGGGQGGYDRSSSSRLIPVKRGGWT